MCSPHDLSKLVLESNAKSKNHHKNSKPKTSHSKLHVCCFSFFRCKHETLDFSFWKIIRKTTSILNSLRNFTGRRGGRCGESLVFSWVLAFTLNEKQRQIESKKRGPRPPLCSSTLFLFQKQMYLCFLLHFRLPFYSFNFIISCSSQYRVCR